MCLKISLMSIVSCNSNELKDPCNQMNLDTIFATRERYIISYQPEWPRDKDPLQLMVPFDSIFNS